MSYLNILNKFSLLFIVSFILLRPFHLGNTLTSYNYLITIILYLGCLLSIISKKNNYKINIDTLGIFLFTLSLVLSFSIFGNTENSLFKLFIYVCLPLSSYAISKVRVKEKNYIILAVCLGAFILSLQALRAFFIISEYIPKYLEKINLDYYFAREFLERKRAFAPFFLPNLLAGYLIMTLPILIQSLIQAISEKNIFKTIFTVLGSFLTLMVLFLTKSLGAWISLLLAFLIFFLIRKIQAKRTLLVLVLIFLCLTGISIYRLNYIETHASPLFSLKQRILYLKDTATLIKAHPFIGTGLGNFSLKDTRFAHNSYLQIWAEIGILGLTSWLLIMFSFIKKGIKAVKGSLMASGIFIAGVAFLIHNLVDFSFFEPQAAFLWWVIFGLTIAGDEKN